MPRELNKELFESLKRDLEKAESIMPSQPAAGATAHYGAPTFEITEKDWMQLIDQIRQMIRRQKELEVALQRMETATAEKLGSAKIRIERIGSGAQRLDEKSQLKFAEIAEKLGSLVGRVTERKVSEQKIEEMLSRHNQTVQNFELRLTQMQKVISEQELKLVGYQSALRDALQELDRIKRI